MDAYPDLQARPRNSAYHGRHWNRRSAAWASTGTGKSAPQRNSGSIRRPCSSFIILLSTRRDSGAHFLSFQCLPNGGQVASSSCVGAQVKRRTTMNHTAKLKIVWRNPRPTHRRHRWEQAKHDSRATHYLIQEMVSTMA